jgi:parallel beta-helix repeat protein
VGVVEMDGLQRRYRRARDTKEYLVDKISEVDVVGRLRSSWFWDEAAHVLRLHTSDDAPPASHEVELIHRGNGIAMTGIRHVTVMGFTFRHMGDAGVNFFKGSGDAIALHNTAYGCRQGIRVYGATRVRVAGNTLFRNDNSGVYFAAESSRGKATGNVAYENIKGLRWSSKSEHALAAGNVAFDNVEAGIALEEVKDALLSCNTLAANAGAQLLALSAAYGTERNCYETAGSPGLLADFVFGERYRTLAEYQQARHADLDARDGGCGPLPPKVDVRRIHADATVYAERARAQLAVR